MYKVLKKEGSDTYTVQPSIEFPILHSADDDVVALDIDSNGKYMMTCSSNKNDLVLFDLKGSLLQRVDTFQMTTNFASVSPCGTYVAACGFTPDVKVWTVKGSKQGFDKASRAFELTGHTSGIYHMAWRKDSSHAATISKDGTWKLFKIDAEFMAGKLVASGPVDLLPTSKLALSPDGKVMAITRDKNILIYALEPKPEFVTQIENVHTQPINNILFDAGSRWLITSGDKHIRIFHNVVGYQRTLIELKQTLQDAITQGHKERLEQQIEELKQKLKAILE